MRNATRNRVIMWITALLFTASMGAFVWIATQVSEGGDRWSAAAVALAVVWAMVLALAVRDARQMRRAERFLEAEGIELPDRQPLPLKLARDRQSLVAGIVALLLIGLAFVAYHTGWLAEAGFTSARPD